jgi:dCMP deaminase
VIPPRVTPGRDEKYMALAWFYAGFSKDPNTQVGSVIIDEKNTPLGHGYNGPPHQVNDSSFSWERPHPNDTDFNKYDIVVHAEINAIDHSFGSLKDATLYVTHFPCPHCMLAIARKNIKRVCYMDHRYDPNSSINNQQFRKRSQKVAELTNVTLDEFDGNISWMADWILRLRELGIFNHR